MRPSTNTSFPKTEVCYSKLLIISFVLKITYIKISSHLHHYPHFLFLSFVLFWLLCLANASFSSQLLYFLFINIHLKLSSLLFHMISLIDFIQAHHLTSIVVYIQIIQKCLQPRVHFCSRRYIQKICIWQFQVANSAYLKVHHNQPTHSKHNPFPLFLITVIKTIICVILIVKNLGGTLGRQEERKPFNDLLRHNY